MRTCVCVCVQTATLTRAWKEECFFKGLLHLAWGLFHFIGKPIEEGDVRQIEWERDLGCKSAVTIQLAERHATYVLHHATCIFCIPMCVYVCVCVLKYYNHALSTSRPGRQ